MKLSAEDAFRLYGDRVFSAAFSVTGNQADADDAVQDTYLRYCSYDKEFADEDHHPRMASAGRHQPGQRSEAFLLGKAPGLMGGLYGNAGLWSAGG